MSRLLALISALAAVPLANAQSTVKCEDGTKAVTLNLTFAKKDSMDPPKSVVIVSSGKSKEIEKKQILRFIRNANEFYLLFKVSTKAGLHDLELNTRFNKSPRGPRTAAGTLINKTQDERLNVTCWF